ncbi:hypothetical protein SARC_09829 [Sphaeroforma arctica JP610]|uniref:Cwf19-like C-terminal domain-containing protein n=1 Tax=Sphaeroforma arctica JP610 TaxID=667725 RepID=A0A0L0FLR6_9EUKA|nr:hypothetical protein SARC_09829 [Sphaeroforma arctica JP610]KNC77722.1 hypothetical protein SARC_09829 [Sphaeroforma arctica JP610]|eukprot:XP_014151624.1 hypothetical protein SARC_09829 [Sphaeroforma arctica JP610]
MAEAGVGRKKFPKQEPLSPCWFCLSSPQVEKHLVVSIGTDMYIAYAKGHLVCEHVLILPINHIGSTRHLSEEAKTELKQHQAALKKYYKEVLGMNLVMFERSYASRHMQIQCIPISSSIPTEEVKAAFRSHGNLSGFPFDDVSAPDKDTATTPNPPHSRNKGFFLVEFADGSQMVHTHVPGEERFPLQFGREVIGSEKICNLPDRIDWKACKVSLEEETALVQQMRKAFGPYEVED